MQKTCSCHFLYGPETSEPALQRLHKALEGHQEHRAEICFYRKDGKGAWPALRLCTDPGPYAESTWHGGSLGAGPMLLQADYVTLSASLTLSRPCFSHQEGKESADIISGVLSIAKPLPSPLTMPRNLG